MTYAFASQLGIIDLSISDTLMAITALSMTITPILMVILDKVIFPKMSTSQGPKKEMDTIETRSKVILVGFSHFGSTLGRFLRANGVEATVLDYNPDRVDFLRKMGFKVYYGDATRLDLLHAAGAEEATLLISAIKNPETNLKLIEICKENFPKLEIMLRAKNRVDAYELMEAGMENIYREHLDTSIRMGEDALKKLGFRAHTIHRLAASFKKYDEEALKVLVQYKNNQKEYISKIKLQIESQETLLSGELSRKFSMNDHAWDSEAMKNPEN